MTPPAPSRGAIVPGWLATPTRPQAHIWRGTRGACAQPIQPACRRLASGHGGGPAIERGAAAARARPLWPVQCRARHALAQGAAAESGAGRGARQAATSSRELEAMLFAALGRPHHRRPMTTLPDTGVGLERERWLAPAFIRTPGRPLRHALLDAADRRAPRRRRAPCASSNASSTPPAPQSRSAASRWPRWPLCRAAHCRPSGARRSAQPERHLLVRDAGFIERRPARREAGAAVEADRAGLRVQHDFVVAARARCARPALRAAAGRCRPRARWPAPPCGRAWPRRARSLSRRPVPSARPRRLKATACSASASAASCSSAAGMPCSWMNTASRMALRFARRAWPSHRCARRSSTRRPRSRAATRAAPRGTGLAVCAGGVGEDIDQVAVHQALSRRGTRPPATASTSCRRARSGCRRRVGRRSAPSPRTRAWPCARTGRRPAQPSCRGTAAPARASSRRPRCRSTSGSGR